MRDIPIAARQLRALYEFCLRYGVSLRLVSSRIRPIPGLYEGDSLSCHVRDWVQARYGDRLKVRPSFGSLVLLLREDLWKMTLPFFFGGILWTCEPELPGAEFNIVRFIEGMTPDFARTLAPSEIAHIAERFGIGLCSLMDLQSIVGQPYVHEAMGDLSAAVSFILASPPQFGQSRWASLQAAEKMVKSYGRTKGVTFPKKHDLADLVARANALGLPPIDPALVNQLGCDPGARYGEIPVTKTEAVSAHQASVEVVGHATAAIRASLPTMPEGQGTGI